MKRMIETKARIEKTVEIPLKSREVNIGNGVLGWTHKSDTTMSNVTWISGNALMASASVDQIRACQRVHPSYMDVTPEKMMHTTKGEDLTDFSTANDWVFLLDMSSYEGRAKGKETLTGTFANVSPTAINLVTKIELETHSAYDESVHIGELLKDGGCKEFNNQTDGMTYIIIPNEFVSFFSANKNAFVIDFQKILGESFRVYNEVDRIQTDTRYIPMIDLKDNPITDLD